MIVGVGIDIFDVRRMAAELREGGPAFRDAVFTPAEVAYCEAKRYPAQHFAARFAAKEAAVKALGLGIGAGMAWREAEIRNEAGGRPSLVLHGGLRRAAEASGAGVLLVSLSHTADLAIACVVLESSAA